MRLNAYLARAGVASRRRADELIKSGSVTVNGQLGKLNTQVSGKDEVIVNDKLVRLQSYRYILLNKPTGYVSTLHDPEGRPKVTDLIDVGERVVPVGRLDIDTAGLLVLTNDGELANQLMHPAGEVIKTYVVQVKGAITDAKLYKLSNGVELEDGLTAPAKAVLLDGSTIELSLHEGRKRQVKRMVAAVGLKFVSLQRTKYAFLTTEGLNPGQWRDLTQEEIGRLKMLQWADSGKTKTK